MGVGLSEWAAAKVNAAGAFIDQSGDFESISKTGSGTYALVLKNALGVAECCPVASSWYKPSTDPVPTTIPVACGLSADGVTVVVNIVAVATGLATDGAFCVFISRFDPA
jgi:hypothetical protein